MPRLLFLITMGLATAVASARQVPNFAAANLVLGQSDFATATVPGTPTATSLDTPSAVVVDAATGKVFVSDTGNNRVLRYASAAALQNGASAEAVFGQQSFTTNGAPPAAADSLDSPTAIWIDSGAHLWVADTDNNRVVMYANATTSSNGPVAALILGQLDPTSETLSSPPTAASLSNPEGLCVDSDGRLWVADKGNNRVLRFDNATGNTTGDANAAADGVFGQGQGMLAYTTSTGGSDNLHFTEPSGVAIDASGILWVSDRGNHRIMGFPSAATISDGANGARILGQPDYNMGSNSPGLSSSRISAPAGLFADAAGNLWLLDQGNNRALRFADIKSIDNGKPASGVIGQPDFTTNTTGLDARELATQAAGGFANVFVQSDGTVWISDRNHHRVLRFAIEDSDLPTVTIKGKRKVTTTKSRIVVKGTASDDTGVTSVSVKSTGKPALATGTAIWKKAVRLKKIRTVVKAYATDAAGKISAPAKVIILRKAKPLL